MRRALTALALALLLGCGGSETREETPPPEPDFDRGAPAEREAAPGVGEEKAADAQERQDASAMTEKERLLAAHRARQDENCAAMCTRLTECVLADTRENAPEKLEDVDVEELARHYRERKCLSPCQASELSVRQVDTMEACTEAESSCEELLDCLDDVQPQET